MLPSFVPNRLAFVAAVSLAIAAGCAAKNSGSTSGDDTAGPGDDAAQTESNTESFGSLFVSDQGGGAIGIASFDEGGSLRAENVDILSGDGGVASGSFPNLQPPGCVTVTANPATKTNTYVFADCTGPWGLVHLNGTVTVTYASSAPNQLTLSFSAQGFKINGATITQWTATADITANGTMRTMKWDGSFTGTTANGRDFERQNHKQLAWSVGSGCLGISGYSEGTVTGHRLKTTITDYNRCRGECPEAMSDIDVLNEDNGKEVNVLYNGGRSATVTLKGSNGGSTTINLVLACQG